MVDVVLALVVLGLLVAALPVRSYRFEHAWDKRPLTELPSYPDL
jgi:hypothetical protein